MFQEPAKVLKLAGDTDEEVARRKDVEEFDATTVEAVQDLGLAAEQIVHLKSYLQTTYPITLQLQTVADTEVCDPIPIRHARGGDGGAIIRIKTSRTEIGFRLAGILRK